MRSQLKTERITPNSLSWMSAPVKERDGDYTFPSIAEQCVRRDLKINRAHISNGATHRGLDAHSRMGDLLSGFRPSRDNEAISGWCPVLKLA